MDKKTERLTKPTTNPLEVLLFKLDNWLVQQPEWGIIFYAGRKQRRDLARGIAHHITTIPNRNTIRATAVKLNDILEEIEAAEAPELPHESALD